MGCYAIKAAADCRCKRVTLLPVIICEESCVHCGDKIVDSKIKKRNIQNDIHLKETPVRRQN